MHTPTKLRMSNFGDDVLNADHNFTLTVKPVCNDHL